MKTKNKRGELTSKQLITIIILIVSFAVILIFFLALNFPGKTDKEICKNSIQMKSMTGVFSGIVSLRCKTQKMCITTGQGCPNAGKNIDNIKVSGSKDDLKNNVMKELAYLQADSWDMVFEGETIFPGAGKIYVFYVVYFDDEIQKDLDIKLEDYVNLLKKLEHDKYETYFKWFFHQTYYKGNYYTKVEDTKNSYTLKEPIAIAVMRHIKGHSFLSSKSQPVIFEFSVDQLKTVKGGLDVWVNF